MVNKPLLEFDERGGYFEVQQNDCRCESGSSWVNGFVYKPERRRLQFGWLGLFLFSFALVSSFYLVWKWHQFQELNREYRSQVFKSELKLVSLFNRHGDRAPSDDLPEVDKHKQAIEYFWPNGLHNLTDLGKARSHKLGLSLRQLYQGHIGYDHRQVLAFSSDKLRCIESLQNTLKGFYEIEGPRTRGLDIVAQWKDDNCTECLPDGSGSPAEWKLVSIDTKTIKTLTEREVEQCRYRKEHPSPLEQNLKLHPEVKSLPGIDRLEQILVQRYGLKGLQGGAASAIFSTITSELNLARTSKTIQFTDHFSDWVNQEVASTPDGRFSIKLYDIFEQATLIKYRDQIEGLGKWLEIGPIVTSLVRAQSVALGIDQQTGLADNERVYLDKRIIFYSSHDSILQRILQHLDLIRFDEHLTYEQRYYNWRLRGANEFDKFMSGLSMSFYGMSIKFELWESKRLHSSLSGETKFPYVQVSLYNQEDARFGDIVYQPLRLGDACTRLFERMYPDQKSEKVLDSFYNYDFPIDWSYGCPFELFKNVTSELMVEEQKYKELC